MFRYFITYYWGLRQLRMSYSSIYFDTHSKQIQTLKMKKQCDIESILDKAWALF